MGEGRKCNGDKQDREDSNRAPAPTFLSLAGQKWEKEQRADHDDRADEQRWRLHRRRQERKHRVQPQEEVIGSWRRLDDRRVRLTGWSERSEVRGAGVNRQHDKRGEEYIFPDRIGDERSALLPCQFVILVFVGCFLDQ